MSGIVFLRCRSLEETRSFYVGVVGMTPWLEQPGISILRHGNLLLGFQQAEHSDRGCLVTFFYETREEVDRMHSLLSERAKAPPRVNGKYRIYNFFATDPEGRDIEFQAFLHPIEKI